MNICTSSHSIFNVKEAFPLQCNLYEARTDSFVIMLAYSGDVTKEIYLGVFHWCYYHSSNQNNFKFIYGISANIQTKRTSWSSGKPCSVQLLSLKYSIQELLNWLDKGSCVLIEWYVFHRFSMHIDCWMLNQFDIFPLTWLTMAW